MHRLAGRTLLEHVVGAARELAPAAIHTVYGHGGGFPGINGRLDIYPEQGLVVTALSNLDGGASLIAGRFMEMIEFGRLLLPARGKEC